MPPLYATRLVLVLREPARVLGVGFESDELVGHIVQSAEDQPGAMPLLAELFTDLWERMRERGDGTLRVSDPREIIQVGARCRSGRMSFGLGTRTRKPPSRRTSKTLTSAILSSRSVSPTVLGSNLQASNTSLPTSLGCGPDRYSTKRN